MVKIQKSQTAQAILTLLTKCTFWYWDINNAHNESNTDPVHKCIGL